MKKIFCLILVVFSFWIVKPVMAAGPMLKFVPSTGTYKKGETFNINIGVDSGTEKVQAIDINATFDASKVEVDSIKALNNDTFLGFRIDQNIYNDTGKFTLSLYNEASSFEAGVVTGDLVTVTFRPKATGTINVNFACIDGSTVDTNINNNSAVDVINCASNINGVYTINEGGAPNNPNPTAVPTAVPTTGTELPKTGTVETTIALIVFGVVSLLSSLALKFL